MAEKRALTAQLKDFFGYRPGTGLKEFSAELKALTYQDKVDFAKMFNDYGLPTEEPAKPPTA